MKTEVTMNPEQIAQKLLRPHLRTMVPYSSARRSASGGSIWLNANESPYTGNYNICTTQLNRYPNFQSQTLNAAYADYADVYLEQVMSHRGSDEGIDLLIRAFCEPGQDSILICPPTYGMYSISATLNNNAVVSIPLINHHNTWRLDIPAIQAALVAEIPVKIIFLCNPSNPLGSLLHSDDITTVLELAVGKAIVVVDEAYIEYAGTIQNSQIHRLNTHPHLVVLRTLSKAFGLAGARVGFTLAHETIIQSLVPVLAPYPLTDMSIQVAESALTKPGISFMLQNITETIIERNRLSIELAQLTWVTHIYPSTTNFILLQVKDTQAVIQYCQQHGILLRSIEPEGLKPCIRISVGSPAENKELLRVLNCVY